MTVDLNSPRAPFNFLDSSRLRDVQDAAKNGSDRDSIGNFISRAVDRFMEFISSDNRSEVKRCLYDLYSPETSATVKRDAFEKLTSLAGPGNAKRFSIENPIDGDYQKCELSIDLDFDKSLRFSLAKTEIFVDIFEPQFNENLIAEDLAGILQKDFDIEQWIKDVVRDGVELDGVMVKSDEEFNARAKERGYSADEMLSIKKLCVQTTIGVMAKRAIDGVQMNIVTGNTPERIIKVGKYDAGKLNIDILTKFDKIKDYTFDDAINYMSELSEGAVDVMTSDNRKLTQCIAGDLKLKLQLSAGQQKPDVQLIGHVGFCAAPLSVNTIL